MVGKFDYITSTAKLGFWFGVELGKIVIKRYLSILSCKCTNLRIVNNRSQYELLCNSPFLRINELPYWMSWGQNTHKNQSKLPAFDDYHPKDVSEDKFKWRCLSSLSPGFREVVRSWWGVVSPIVLSLFMKFQMSAA